MDKMTLAVLLLWMTSGGSEPDTPKSPKGAVAMHAITIVSTAFKQMEPIPEIYTCDGADVSPPLSWSEVPPAARSIALICDDPDAPRGTWVHWVAYDLPPTCTALPQGVEKTKTLKGGGKQGKNDFPEIGYNGPCPPRGMHRYYFKIYALDTMLDLPPGMTRREVEKAMKGHILAQGELVGTYARKPK